MPEVLTPAAPTSGRDPAGLSDTAAAASMPTSFGVFKPVGSVMIGLPTQGQTDALVAALHSAGWTSDAVLHFTPRDSVAELQALVDGAGGLAGFGYEITLLRRYLELAQAGHRWLLVKVDDVEHAGRVAAIARDCGAQLAVHYRMLTVEELI